MQFLYPSFLWALGLLAIPVIIHLFYFRRFKKVYFTNVRFLKEVKEETSSRNKLKNLLVLLMRMLALAFLILAFAQPFIPVSNDQVSSRNQVGIFLDNSFSMNALSEDVVLFDRAKDKAREIVQAFSEEDQFQVLNHDIEARHQRLVSQEDALAFIDEMELSPDISELSKIQQFQLNTLNDPDFRRSLYYISDFQKNITDLQLSGDSSFQYHFIVLQSVKEQNVSIDSAWFVAPVPMINQPNPIVVRLSNYSDSESENIQMNLFYEDQNRPLGVVSVPPNSSVTDTFNISIRKTGWHEAKIQIQDYPVQFDDVYQFSFRVKEEVDILSINTLSSNEYLDAAFGGLDYFRIENSDVNQLSYGDFANFDLIILNDLVQLSSGLRSALSIYTEGGGNLLIFPGQDVRLDDFNDFFRSINANMFEERKPGENRVSQINTDEFIFSDVFESTNQNITLPVVEVSYSISQYQTAKEEKLLRYRDGTSFLSKYNHGEGQVYICTAPLSSEFSNLVRNAEIFVPMLYKMAISTARKDKIAYVIGEDQVISVDNLRTNGEAIYRISGPVEFIPAQFSVGPKVMLDMKDQVRAEGIYDLTIDGTVLTKLSFNYSRSESDLSCFSSAELRDMYGDRVDIINERLTQNLAGLIAEKNNGISLWKWCIILVLIFLTLESLILRFWKT